MSNFFYEKCFNELPLIDVTEGSSTKDDFSEEIKQLFPDSFMGTVSFFSLWGLIESLFKCEIAASTEL